MEAQSSVMHGDHWKPIPKIDGDFANFRNNGMSRGFDGIQPVDPTKPLDKMPDKSLMITYGMYASMMGGDFFDKYYDNRVGNPEGPEVDGRILTQSDLLSIYDAWAISQHVHNIGHIVEIGPGFGALSGILKKIYPNAKLTLVDLPEHEPVTRYYLENTVGMENIEITSELPDSADLVIAIRCLMEMPTNEVAKYIDWIQKSDVSWFYFVNRYFKKNVTKWYPFDNKWLPVINRSDYITGQLHEFLLKRTEEESNILKHLLDTIPPFVMPNSEIIAWWKGIIQVTGNVRVDDNKIIKEKSSIIDKITSYGTDNV